MADKKDPVADLIRSMWIGLLAMLAEPETEPKATLNDITDYIQESAVEAYKAGAASVGKDVSDPHAALKVASFLHEQKQAMADFMAAAPSMDQDATERRASFYATAVKSQYWAGMVDNADTTDLISWHPGDTVEKCADCVRMAEQSPMTVEQFRLSGFVPQSWDLECHGLNCQCWLSHESIANMSTDKPFSAEFSIDRTNRQIDGVWSVYSNSLLFKSGDYEDKKFALTPEELTAAAESFDPSQGRGNIEHTDFLAGRAARIRRVWSDDGGQTLRGEVAIPFALDELLTDDERRLSCEWDRKAKRLCGIALTTKPRVQEAALMSAYASFAADPANPDRLAALQQMHDIAVAHGAGCKAILAGANRAPAMFKDKRKMTIKEFLARWSSKPAATLDDEIDAADFSAESAVETPTKPEDAKPNPEIEALKAEIAKMSAESRKRDAEEFAANVIAEKRALPAEKDHIVAAFIRAANDDMKLGDKVTFGATDGESKAVDGSRVDALKSLYAVRTPHVLTQELLRETVENAEDLHALFAKTKTEDPENPQPFAKRTKADLLKMTPLGESVAKEIK